MSYQKSTSLNPQVCKVEIISTDDVQQINLGATRIYRSVVLKSGKSWQLLYSTVGKIDFSEEQFDEPAGPSFKQKLEFPYPGEDSTTRTYLNNIENQRLLTLITFNSGIKKLLGNLENPCLLWHIFSLEKGGRTVRITCNANGPSLLV